MNEAEAGKSIVMPTVFPVACHTDNVGQGSTFVAIKGARQDGATYIPCALEYGASTIIVQEDVVLSRSTLESIEHVGAGLQRVANTRVALSQLSAQAHNHPAKKLRIIGITGTKGKTSTAFMLEHILKKVGRHTALVSTVHNSIKNSIFEAQLTTPHPDYLHAFLAACVKAGVEYVVMEVAAQALSLHRVDGIQFDGALFTNFDREHAEFYETLDDYFAAKCMLFDQLKPGAPVLINRDNDWGKKLVARNPGSLSFGVQEKSLEYRARLVETVNLLTSCISFSGGNCFISTCSALFGVFNAYNVLGAISMAHALGIPLEQSTQCISDFPGTPGRLERHELPNGAYGFIDKAHNPSSFRAALSSLRAMKSQFIVVFGAGGDRHKTKRPEKGAIATEY